MDDEVGRERAQPAGTGDVAASHENEALILPLGGETAIGGTLVWYYTICPREAWLMGHAIQPDSTLTP